MVQGPFGQSDIAPDSRQLPSSNWCQFGGGCEVKLASAKDVEGKEL